jgi:hypothetical protein
MPFPDDLPLLRSRSVRADLCRGFKPPFANEPHPPEGIEPFPQREWTGQLVITDDRDRAWSMPDSGTLGFDVHADQGSDASASGSDSGLFKATVLQRVAFQAPVAAPTRLRLQFNLVIDRFHLHTRRYPVPPLPHSSSVDWMTEFHVYLPGQGEVLKLGLGSRSLNGSTQFDRQVDIVAPGTSKIFTATTDRSYDPSQPLLVRFGLWTEFRVSSRQMRFFNLGELRLRVTSLVICPCT